MIFQGSSLVVNNGKLTIVLWLIGNIRVPLDLLLVYFFDSYNGSLKIVHTNIIFFFWQLVISEIRKYFVTRGIKVSSDFSLRETFEYNIAPDLFIGQITSRRRREGGQLLIKISPHFSTFYISQYLNSTRAQSEVKKGTFYSRDPEAVFNLYQILARRKLFYVKHFAVWLIHYDVIY